MLQLCDGCNGLGQVRDCESVTTGGGWPQLSTRSSLGALIHLFNSWMPVFPSGQYPARLRSLAHWGIASEKRWGRREWTTCVCVCVSVWCLQSRLETVRTATLSFYPCKNTRLYLQCVCVCVDFNWSVFLCCCSWGLFDDVHSKTGRRVAGGIKVLTLLH